MHFTSAAAAAVLLLLLLLLLLFVHLQFFQVPWAERLQLLGTPGQQCMHEAVLGHTRTRLTGRLGMVAREGRVVVVNGNRAAAAAEWRSRCAARPCSVIH